MSDLIERLEIIERYLLDVSNGEDAEYEYAECIHRTIEALRPVENAEVKTVLADLDDAETEFFNLNSEGYAADIRTGMNLIERLARQRNEARRDFEMREAEIDKLESQLAEAREMLQYLEDNDNETLDNLRKELAEAKERIGDCEEAKAALDNWYEKQIESLQAQIAGLEKNIAFYKSCLCSGEIPEDGAEPYTRIRQMGEK